MIQPYAFFYLALQGQIESGHFMDLDGLAIKYAFVAGDDWEIANGKKQGEGQYCFKGTRQAESGQSQISWNFPFEIQYRSLSPAGWPRLVLFCMSKDWLGNEYVKAYGSVSVPTTPGQHSKTVRMYSPIATAGIMEYLGFQQPSDGIQALIENPETVASPEGREVSRVVAAGKVNVTINCFQRNLGRHGYVVDSK